MLDDLLFLTQLGVYLLHLFWPKVKNSAKSQLDNLPNPVQARVILL